jgi:hypothetical protein
MADTHVHRWFENDGFDSRYDDDCAFGKIRFNLEVSYSVKTDALAHPQQFMQKQEERCVKKVAEALNCEVDCFDTKLFFYEYYPSQEFDEVHIATYKEGGNN